MDELLRELKNMNKSMDEIKKFLLILVELSRRQEMNNIQVLKEIKEYRRNI